MQVAFQHHSCCHTADDDLHCQQQSTNLANHQAFGLFTSRWNPSILTSTDHVGFVVDTLHFNVM